MTVEIQCWTHSSPESFDDWFWVLSHWTQIYGRSPGAHQKPICLSSFHRILINFHAFQAFKTWNTWRVFLWKVHFSFGGASKCDRHQQSSDRIGHVCAQWTPVGANAMETEEGLHLNLAGPHMGGAQEDMESPVLTQKVGLPGRISTTPELRPPSPPRYPRSILKETLEFYGCVKHSH